MNFLSPKKQSSMAIVGSLMITLGVELTATANTFHPVPLFSRTANYSTKIPRSGGDADAADIYYPVVPKTSKTSLPIALLLQGALVDKSDYSKFANAVARYGFVVVVPNHSRTANSPTRKVTGLLSEQQQVNDVLTYMRSENSRSTSPIANQLNLKTLVLLGHSFGGAVGIAAIQGKCFAIFCTKDFSRPDELKGGVFYGANFLMGQNSRDIPVIENDAIPIALIQGNLDGVAKPSSAQITYEKIQDQPKALITVAGANHYGITNEDNSKRESNRPTLEQEVAIETIARWSALFLRATVLKDKQAFDYVFNSGDALDLNVKREER
ncbi:chlorophyllase [Nostoc sp. NIES-2111]